MFLRKSDIYAKRNITPTREVRTARAFVVTYVDLA